MQTSAHPLHLPHPLHTQPTAKHPAHLAHIDTIHHHKTHTHHASTSGQPRSPYNSHTNSERDGTNATHVNTRVDDVMSGCDTSPRLHMSWWHMRAFSILSAGMWLRACMAVQLRFIWSGAGAG
eukprot:gene3866-8390_t